MKKRSILVTVIFLIILIIFLSACAGGSEQADTEPEPAEILIPGRDETETSPSPVVPDREISVEITEVMYSNKTSIRDSYGYFSDWIELENKGSETCSLEDFWLSDDSEVLMKWRFPAVSVEPGERLIVFCSGNESTENELHTGFSLAKEGEPLYFSYPSGRIRTSIIPTGELEDDISLCIDGESCYTTYDATPGYPNTEEGREAFITEDDQHGALVINEACPFNETYKYLWGGYYDWIELKNVSSSAIKLSNYFLTDDPNEPKKYQLPKTTLQPGKTYMVICSGDTDLSRYTICWFGFALDTNGDQIYLFDSEGTLSDKAGIHEIPLRGSVGRLAGKSGFFHFQKATPEKENTGGYRFRTDMPKTLTATGIYDDIGSISVELTGNGTIYYTTDGTVPTKSSTVYSEPIILDRTTVIRAAAAESGKMISKPASFSYIINEHHTMPVISVACDGKSFRNVYAYATDHSKYCDATVSYFGDDGTFTADCAFKLHGSSARTVLTKKHFKLVFSGRYGGDLQYNLFDSEKFVGLHSFTLRGGELENMHLVKDSLTAIIANKVSPIDPYTLDSRYCILYINGEYWGIYAMREAYSGTYIETHTDIDRNAAFIVRAPELGNQSEDFYKLIRYINTHDMGKAKYYSYVEQRFDLRTLALWMCLESYFNNADPTGNIRYFRDDTSVNSKWQVMFFDLDISLGNPHALWTKLNDPSSQIGLINRSLLKSKSFKTLLLQTASELLENGLCDELCLETYRGMIDELEPESARNLSRWKESRAVYEKYKEHMVEVFSGNRVESWLSGLQTLIKASDEDMALYFPDYY
ncbi:MAG: CotH kinase family protein [Clostridia bacterium]|nr:CotH kinase family protein [Clostridia bacterium]